MRPNKREFFVGYLNTPAGLKRFYNIVVPMMMALLLAVGAWLALQQKNAGSGTWDLSNMRAVSGFLTVDPYPVLHLAGPDRRSIILVQEGKKSATDVLERFSHSWIALSGFMIKRGDWSMLELPLSTVVEVLEAPSGDLEAKDLLGQPLGKVSMQGEIIDSKCFLGVMKPGSGKVHRACASMCLLGGMPPMFVVKNNEGERFGYLLMNEDGSSAAIDLADNVAVPVNLSGQLELRGDLMYIRYQKASVSRLTEQQIDVYGETLAENKMRAP